ncbi:MAG: hypothetical protein EOR57_31485 [Mesorhizobium sp.]|uniref:MucR family transcriptional regulator n=1 Tax=Mesorhizobium sp. TaxID=1871066 RepID=UPI000FE998E2|nr:MucR family transcriptional regulator [Mesorhizobium sp.]RWL14870.1 MAG: hypothetical protein EOR57_31485 [Mesorhizobium sp.]
MTGPLSGNLFSFHNKGMRSNNPRTASKKRGHAIQSLMARLGEEGFPIEAKFTNPEDIADYFSGERIVCLRCGNPFKSLGSHINKIHGWTADAYKEFYGLPWSTGLCGAASKAIRSEHGKRTWESGVGLAGMSAPDRDHARALAHRSKHRPVTAANLNRANRLVLRINHHKNFTQADYDAVLRLMLERDMTAKEVLGAPDLPSVTMFYAQMRANPVFASEYAETVETLSFAAQWRCQGFGKRFATECRRLRDEGKTVAEAARMLNTSKTTVLKWSGGFGKPIRTHCRRGHPKEVGRSNCKVCNAAAARLRRRLK